MEETKRTQKYIPIHEWDSGEREADFVDFSQIDKVPLEFFAHPQDEHCLYEEVLKMQKEISSPVDIRLFARPQESLTPANHIFTSGRNTDRYFFY